MTDKYIDFDKYRKEKEDDKIIIKAFGEELELPPSPKLETMEKIIEMMNIEGADSEMPEQEVLNMLESLLGKEQLQTLKEKGITISEAEWLLTQLWQQYNQEEDDTKNQMKDLASQKNGEQ